MIDEALARLVRVVVREELDRTAAQLVQRLAPAPAPLAPGGDPLLPVAVVAAELGVRPGTIRRWVARGLLRSVDLGGPGQRRSLRVARTELDRFVRSHVRRGPATREAG